MGKHLAYTLQMGKQPILPFRQTANTLPCCARLSKETWYCSATFVKQKLTPQWFSRQPFIPRYRPQYPEIVRFKSGPSRPEMPVCHHSDRTGA